MSKRPLEDLKPIANQYAQFIMEHGCDIRKEKEFRIKLGFSENGLKAEEKELMEEKSDEYVGIWKKSIKDGAQLYVRDKKYVQEYRFWADVQTIPEKKADVKRIVYLGESVARGYLYSPFFTPGEYLEDTLNQTAGKPAYEVIDLARISIGIVELEELCEQSMALKPDNLVIFAGNNWKYSIYPFTDEEAGEITAAEETESCFQVVEEVIRKKFEQIIWKFMDKINALSEQYHVPVIFVLPEFNLKDWVSISDDEILMWPNKQSTCFRKRRKDMETDWIKGKEEEAVKIAKELAVMNPASPKPYDILAEYSMKQGRIEEALQYYEIRRDTSMYRRIFQPVCVSFIKETVKEAASKYQFRVVDLRKIFKEYLKNDIAGYNLFIDYCHLNAEGIQVSMTALAEAIIGNEQKANVTAKPSEKMPDCRVSAQAYFLTAIHCAHMCEQPYEILYRHCKKALAYSSHIAELMVHYINLVNCNIPWAFNKEAEYFCKLNLFNQYPLLFQPDDCAVMDIELVNAMADALLEEGIDLKEQITSNRNRFFASHGQGVDLLSPYFREKSYYYSQKSSSYFSFGKKCFISSIDKYTHFYFIADEKQDVEIEVTYRAQNTAEEKVVFLVNGITVQEAESNKNWRDTVLKINRSLLNENKVNELIIIWPDIDKIEREILENNKKRYSGDELIIRNSRPIYGELFRLNEYSR